MGLSSFFDIEEFSIDNEKKKLIEHLEFLKAMSVKESTLYKKWQEFNYNEFGLREKASKFDIINSRLWKPTDIYDKELTIKEINALDPYVEFISSDKVEMWTLYRMLIHTMDWVVSPGRHQKYLVKDRTTRKVLGLISLGSDVTTIGARDKYIGWSKKNKFENGKLNNSAIASTIVSTQPLGYNMLGGKLIAALTTSLSIRNQWYNDYKNMLVGITTTSLYGIHSQYNSIPHWKTLGESTGKINIKPDELFYTTLHKWYKDTYPDAYCDLITPKEGVHGPVTGIKQKILKAIYKKLGISFTRYEHGYKRGVYYANMYDNGLEYLRNEIDEVDLKLKLKFKNNIEYTMAWWRKKAIRRYTKLLEQDRIKPEILFYSDILGMTWEEAKEKYLSEVGR